MTGINETPLLRFTERTADLVLVGLLSSVVSLGVVTALGALGAAVATLEREESGSLPTRYLRHLRSELPRTLRPQLLVLLGVIVGVVDLVVGLHWLGEHQPGWLTAPVLACGFLLIFSCVALPPYLAVLPWHDSRVSLRTAIVVACGRPAATIALILVTAVLIMIGIAVPVLTPLLVGGYTALSMRLVRRVPRPRTHSRPARRLDPSLSNS